MDYAFGVPDNGTLPPDWDRIADDYVVMGLAFVSWKGAQLIVDPTAHTPPLPNDLYGTGAPSLERFVRTLNVSPVVTRPVGDILIVAHAGAHGVLGVPLNASPQLMPLTNANYEALQVAAANDMIALKSNAITAPAGSNRGTRVRIMGCDVGAADQFMALLRMALGAPVSAPKHLATFSISRIPHGASDAVALLYYLTYSFRVVREVPIKKRQDLIAAYVAASLKTHDNRNISTSEWNKWVPKKAPTHLSEGTATVKLRLGEPEISIDTRFQLSRIDAPHDIPLSGPAGDQAARRLKAKNYLSTHPYYKEDADFAVHLRHRFATLQDFVNAHAWVPSKDGKSMAGARYEHELEVPITAADGTLRHDLVPLDPAIGPPARDGLDETDPTLFWLG